jgi:hypothetical protein
MFTPANVLSWHEADLSWMSVLRLGSVDHTHCDTDWFNFGEPS